METWLNNLFIILGIIIMARFTFEQTVDFVIRRVYFVFKDDYFEKYDKDSWWGMFMDYLCYIVIALYWGVIMFAFVKYTIPTLFLD